MPIRHGLLALLERGPRHGYQLRAEFESSTGASWPLNIGQVYTTLSRLERDGLVEPAAASDGEGRVPYRITDTGRAEMEDWFETPLAREGRPRDELAIKFAMALTTPGVDVRRVVQTQRTATLRTLRELTRLKTQADETADAAWLLMNELLIFQAEAEVRWLDHCEAQLAQSQQARRDTTTTPTEVAP
ncbi:MAG: PadR family transcriptional regulator [Actinomycetota bacterium]|nr:PadR family transcriptional regulator [Actinomycetota bacterium]